MINAQAMDLLHRFQPARNLTSAIAPGNFLL